MKTRNILLSVLFAVIAISTACCTRVTIHNPDDEASGWNIKFASAGDGQVSLDTKATLSKVSESTIYNMFVAIFSQSGEKLQTAYYSSDNKVSYSEAIDISDVTPSWYVYNNVYNNESDITYGYVKLPAPQATNCTIYAIANIDADMVNVSPERLKAENLTLTDLKNFVATLNQNIITRNGYFPMSGSVSGVNITASGFSGTPTLYLKRLDAKIEFNFMVDHSHSLHTYYEDDGTSYVAEEGVKSFTPLSWKVINVPRSTFTLDYEARGVSGNYGHDAADYRVITEGGSLSDYFFDTDEINFDTITDDGTETIPNDAGGTFSFYISENKREPKGIPPSINVRSEQLKYSGTPGTGNDGTYVYNPDNGPRSFTYADDYSTYVIVKGAIEMDVVDDKAGQTLSGEVQYIIHLGNFGSTGSVDNYNIERNTNYKYNVTIKGMHAIRLEVETSKPGNNYGSYNVETNSGASGVVSVAKEEIAICDCHYVSKTLSFHFGNVNENLTWYVKTPYCNGEPDPITGSTANCPDYKWVHFRINKKDGTGHYFENVRRKYIPRQWESYERTAENYHSASQNKEGDGTDGLAGYHNDGMMDIIQVCAYIKAQHALASDEYGNFIDGVSDFDSGTDLNGDGDFLDAGEEEPKISVTVFVDEYYYYSNPKTGAASDDLWKTFVNQPDRYAYILSKSGYSRDKESRMTGSAITIQQHAIQCIYNTDESRTDLQTAWGLEREDEFNGRWTYWNTTSSVNRGNNDNFNGLVNSLREWNLCSSSSYDFVTGVNWSDYMDFEVDNDTPQLSNSYQYLRYNCMNRNRDNNGDGKIDRSEMRWYTASLRQLIGIYVGEGLIDPNSRLYNRSALQQNSSNNAIWMQHVVSSTQSGNNSNTPIVIWAEEGISTGSYGGNQEGASTKMTVRCVRNLGMAADSHIGYVPQDYVSKTNNSDGTYTFSAEYLNKAALRYYTSRELDMGDQNSEENKLYSKFQVNYQETTNNGTKLAFKEFNELVTEAVSSGGTNPYCPVGYRLPNQRELAMIAYYLKNDGISDDLGDSMSRTYWSFGGLGNGKIPDKYGFSYNGVITLYKDLKLNKARCVRDVRE